MHFFDEKNNLFEEQKKEWKRINKRKVGKKNKKERDVGISSSTHPERRKSVI